MSTNPMACGACCVLPIAVPAIASSGEGSLFAWMGSAYSWSTGIGVLAVLAGWGVVWRQSRAVRTAPATLALMTLTTLVLLASTASRAGDQVAAASAAESVHSAQVMTVEELKAAVDGRDEVHIYDANSRKSFLAGHVPGATWLDYDAVTVKALPASKGAKLVFYCYNPLCMASSLAASAARDLGYTNVWTMPAGIIGWRDAGMPVVSGDKAN